MAGIQLHLNRATDCYEGIERGWENHQRIERTIYVRLMYGNPGYLKEAIARTPGTKYYANIYGNCKQGFNNRIYVQFPDDGREKHVEFVRNYAAICAEKAVQAKATRVKNAEKPKVIEPVAPRPRRQPKPKKVAAPFMISHKVRAMQAQYPAMTFSGMDRYEALDAYEKWYNANHAEQLGMVYFDLKATKREVK